MTQERDPDSPRRSRLEDEVLEILVRSDRPASFSDHVRRRVWRTRRRRLGAGFNGLTAPLRRLGSGGLLLACIASALLAWLLRDASPFAARILGLASFGFLVALVVIGFRQPQGASRKRWRGRDIDLAPGPPPWVDSLRRRFRDRRRW